MSEKIVIRPEELVDNLEPRYSLPHRSKGTRLIATRMRVIAAAAGFALVACICIALIIQWHHRSRPAYVLEILDRINLPEDVQQYNDYFTPQGKDVVLWIMAQAGNKPSSGIKPTYSDPVFSGNVCDIRARDLNASYSIRLRKDGRWQFDDLYFDTANEKSIGLWVSYMKDHPYKTWLTVNWQDLAGSFLKGFMIGLSSGGG